MPSSMPLARFYSLALLAALCCALQASWAQQRLYDKPDLGESNPFSLSKLEKVELPLAMAGYSAVALRDHQQWVPGQRKIQLVFDGQIYWFAGQRDYDIFTAAPQAYAPVLGGDCVVSYVDSGERTFGKLEYGIVHSQRIYFFASAAHRDAFQDNPTRYIDGDLAENGMCVVSRAEKGRKVMGLPETTAVVNGLRYQFAGAYERELFAAGMPRYGVQRDLSRANLDRPVHAHPTNDNVASAESASSPIASPLIKKKGQEETEDHHYIMEGYCPVTIQEQGIWVLGNYQNLVTHNGRKYLLAGEEEKTLFLENPVRYAPVLGGDCVVTLTDTGKLAAGQVKHSYLVDGQLYLFAGASQKQAFAENRTRYIETVKKSMNKKLTEDSTD